MPIIQDSQVQSFEDEHYLAMLAKPTHDEVGADIEQYGHIPVTPETATQDPFTQKGSLANALDAITEPSEADAMPPEAINHQTYNQNPVFQEPTNGEPAGDSERVPEGTKMGEDKASSVKDSLTAAFDEAFAMDSNEEPTEGEEKAHEEWLKNRVPKPKLPDELKDEDKPDGNGLVYITRTFTVDPTKYMSTNYRPVAAPQKPQMVPQKTVGGDVVMKEEVELEAFGTPEAKWSAEEPDEPTDGQERAAAKAADKELHKKAKKPEKDAEDSAPEKVVLDYATYIDGSSFICFDEANGIDYSKVAMDAGPRKKVTRENCQTTFAQCRAQNPLFCRYHGPKLLEKDIKTVLRGMLKGRAGFQLSITKDKDAIKPNTFRVTVACTPSQKKLVEGVLDNFMMSMPGITPVGKRTENDKSELTQEFDMDILRSDMPPKKQTQWELVSGMHRDEAVAKGKTMPVVGETPNGNGKTAKPKAEKPVTENPVSEEPVAEETQPQPEAETPAEPEAEPAVEEVAEEKVEEAEPFGVLEVNEPPEEAPAAKEAEKGETAQSSTTPKPRKRNPYSYEAYGEPPNDDDMTNELEPGGSGDIVGAELLRYAAQNDGILNLPKNWGKYASAMARWKRANKTGGIYHGKPATKLNKPKMADFGIADPMADWIDSFLDGGTRKGDRGSFIALFGRNPREGGNDAILDDAPPEVQALLEKNGPEGVAEKLLKAREDFSKWGDRAKSAAKKRKAQEGKKGKAGDEVISFDDIEARDAADAEYNNAYAEVERYDGNSPTIQMFSREQMKGLKDGDKIRFDHADQNFTVKGYDADNDILTVSPDDWMGSVEEEYSISPDGIELLSSEDITTPAEGEETDGRKDEDGTDETGSGDAQGETGGAESGTGEPEAEPEAPAEVGEGNLSEADIDAAAGAIAASANISQEAAREGLENRLDGKEPVDPSVVNLVKETLPDDSPVVKALEQKEKGEDLALESVTPEELEKEKRRNAERAEIQRLLEAPLKGGTGEIGQSLLDLCTEVGEDLFNRVQSTAETALKGHPTPEIRDAATKAVNAVEDVRRNEQVASELDAFLDEMLKDYSGEAGALIEAAAEDAIEEADEKAEKATGEATKSIKELSRLNEESYRKVEKTAKGNAAAKVESTLANLANAIFTDDSKSDKIGDEAESIATAVADYAKEKGIERELDASVRDVIENIKGDEKKLEGLMEDFQKSMNASGTDFQEEDIGHLAKVIGNLGLDISNQFELLRTMETVEKKRIDDAVELKKQKEELAKKVSQSQSIEPEVKETEPEAESQGETEVETEETEEGVVEKHRERKKPEARDSGNAETRKAAVAAARRLGMDAYKTDRELHQMLNTAKLHMDNPRQAQRAKDIEAVLADRQTKGKGELSDEDKMMKRILSRGAKDEMPEGAIGSDRVGMVAELVLKALEG